MSLVLCPACQGPSAVSHHPPMASQLHPQRGRACVREGDGDRDRRSPPSWWSPPQHPRTPGWPEHTAPGWSVQTELFTQVRDAGVQLTARPRGARAGGSVPSARTPGQFPGTNPTSETPPRGPLVRRSQRFRFSSSGPSGSDLRGPAKFRELGQSGNRFLSPHGPFQSLAFPAGLARVLGA